MKKIKFEKGSGNIFKDLGYKDPELRLAKTDCAIEIRRVVKKKKLGRGDVANILAIPISDVELIEKGIVSGWPLAELEFFLLMVTNYHD